MTTTPALDVVELKKTYATGVEALKGISLCVEQGDFFALLGPNGAGKSTLIGIVSSLVNATGGSVRVLGIIATSLGAAAAITGTALLPIGLSKDNDRLTAAGGISLGGGALLIAAGIWAIRADSPSWRPGSSNHYPLP